MINLCHRLLSLHELNGKLPWKSNLEYQIPPVDLKDALLQWVSIEQHTNRCIWTRNLFLFLFHLLLKPGTYITHNTTYNTTQPPTVETCSLQPQPTLTQVTSLEAIYKTTLSGAKLCWESLSPFGVIYFTKLLSSAVCVGIWQGLNGAFRWTLKSILEWPWNGKI